MTRFFSTNTSIFIFAFPALFIFTAFVVYPLFPEIVISFQKHNGFSSQGFVGFKNYIEIFSSNSFWKANTNTFIIVLLSTAAGLPISLLLAFLLDSQANGTRRYFKAAGMLPAILSVTVIAQMWMAIYEPQWGLLNSLLRAIGLESLSQEWLTDRGIVIFSVAVAFLWQYIGLNTLLFYTGLKSIPKTYYEAALMDGAGPVKSALMITIPLLQEVIKFVLVISILGSMGMFAHVEVMTGGGPGYFSRTIVYELYYKAFMSSEFGVGSAVAVIYVLQCILITLVLNRFVAREKIEF
ncbi:ABC transporter permease [Cohnella sp. CIP 111063]|uniref:carbohydrate ABC transporter permease n=1 Tax=unclassified Cohnella TaxID=2636738 RepID=UPI000B8C0EB9|nr:MULTISPECIES: sugar ABC transporter permease [unclassified Cohnella]OXS58344.1 ABC transporter permease [Cohnella sp. CIP 111063]PRX71628.1 multiple sugar transport system permease protein/raffinose/stachyose/melibiose transport system permease protein [Cohnella sp. SGD-V74]